MQSLETKSSRPRSFDIETRPETFETETETSKNGSRDASRDSITAAGYLRFCWIRIGFEYSFLKKIGSGQDQDIGLISITKFS